MALEEELVTPFYDVGLVHNYHFLRPVLLGQFEGVFASVKGLSFGDSFQALYYTPATLRVQAAILTLCVLAHGEVVSVLVLGHYSWQALKLLKSMMLV